LLAPAGLRVALLTGASGREDRRQVAAGLESGYFAGIVGTHALLEPDVAMPKLGLAVIDERHKFGVRQREAIEQKGAHPDVLMMTATPLPRAMILTRYGDTSLTVLDEMPPGRMPVRTSIAPGAVLRDAAYKFVAERIALGERAFAVFPLVEESESLELRDATREYDRLRARFPGVPAGLLHGRLPPAEKSAIMDRFVKGALQLLVATSVVEVGIDVPEATVMLIEHADRFGLAQLHQLRGRVGRAGRQGWCFLVSTARITAEARARLDALAKTTDGFALAETDLRLRGPGELLGTRQHGQADDDLGDALLDTELLEAARREAEVLLAADPDLKGPEGRKVTIALKTRLAGPWALLRAS
jgi:ATP-dependent DNA helicase RecG